MRHRPGTFAIVITAVRPDQTTLADITSPRWYDGLFARNQRRNPEQVVKTIPLSAGVDREYAQGRASMILHAIPAGAREHYRVKVVTEDGAPC